MLSETCGFEAGTRGAAGKCSESSAPSLVPDGRSEPTDAAALELCAGLPGNDSRPVSESRCI